MYASKPATQDHGVDDQPQHSTQPAPTHAGPTPGVDMSAIELSKVLQGLPYSDMYTFSLALARDLLQRDDPAAVIRVAEALITTAQVWHTAR